MTQSEYERVLWTSSLASALIAAVIAFLVSLAFVSGEYVKVWNFVDGTGHRVSVAQRDIKDIQVNLHRETGRINWIYEYLYEQPDHQCGCLSKPGGCLEQLVGDGIPLPGGPS